MAELPSVFNAEKHEGRMGFSTFPKGKYKMQFVKSELKANKNNKGKHVLLHAKVMEGEAKGRIVFVRLNLVNPNEIAVRIAQDELASICDACGKKAIKDSAELHEIPFWGHVDLVPETDSQPAQNVIKKYESLKAGGSAFNKGKK